MIIYASEKFSSLRLGLVTENGDEKIPYRSASSPIGRDGVGLDA